MAAAQEAHGAGHVPDRATIAARESRVGAGQCRVGRIIEIGGVMPGDEILRGKRAGR
jgi:hypothetical protein